MTQLEILLNPSVAREDEDRLSAQCVRLLDALRKGPRTNTELATMSLKYTSRLSEIRKYLRATGEELKGTRGESGIWTYQIVKGA